MSNLFLEKHSLKQALLPADVNGAGFSGARVSLAKGYKLAIVVSMGDSTGATVQFDLDQHDAPSGGTSKALEIKRNYYVKAGASTSFTKTEIRPDDAGLSDSVDLSADFGSQEGIVVFEVLPEDLDTNNGFSHVSINMASPGAVAKIVACEYVVREIKNGLGYEAEL